MEILGSWCYTRGSRAASIISGEPSVPGEFQVCSVWLNSREASGIDPKRGAVCSREDSRWYDVLSYTSGAASGGGVIDILCLYQVSSTFCLNQVRSKFCLYQGGEGVSLLTPASVGRWAFRRPIHARWVIATALAWLPSWGPLSVRWHSLRQAGIAHLQYCRRLGLAI